MLTYYSHIVVKQEPEDDICWEQRYDQGGGVEDGQLDSATIYGGMTS